MNNAISAFQKKAFTSYIELKDILYNLIILASSIFMDNLYIRNYIVDVKVEYIVSFYDFIFGLLSSVHKCGFHF